MKKKIFSDKNLVKGLAAIIIVLFGYIFYISSDNKVIQATQKEQIAKVSDDKSKLQVNYDSSLLRLDSMLNANIKLSSKIVGDHAEINNLKIKIRTILKKSHITEAEMKRAEVLIKELNTKILEVLAENATLKVDKKQLESDKSTLIVEKAKVSDSLQVTTNAKVELEKKVDIASTLNASNITITPLHVTKSGKEKNTNNANRANKLVVSFSVDNRIAQPGDADIYVIITEPDGHILSSNDSGSLTTRDQESKKYTTKVTTKIETGKKSLVNFDFHTYKFQKGFYKIETYNNGFKIGEATRELKTGIFIL
jgi:hypothetical protein